MQLPDWVLDMQTSDYLIVMAVIAITIFVLDYGVLTPWWRRRHGFIGYIIMLFNISILGLLFLIMWGIVVGERVDEAMRVPVTALVLIGAVGKIVILHYERARGRIDQRRRGVGFRQPAPNEE